MHADSPHTPASSLSSLLPNLPYISFLSSYPHPAFILAARKATGHGGTSLNPLFGNPAFRSLLLGPDSDTRDLDRTFMAALRTVAQGNRFSFWVQRGLGAATQTETLVVELTPSWVPPNTLPVKLELTSTLIDDFLVCTSVPRSPIPQYVAPLQPAPTPVRAREFNLRMPDFPPPGVQVVHAGAATPTATSLLTPVPLGSASHRHIERPLQPQTLGSSGINMREMIANYDWSTTPLGPSSIWPVSLTTSLSYVLSNPFPTALWWGPDIVLMYNDAYAEMAGSKHPDIFAQCGSISWGEIWEYVGPLVKEVQAGNAVSRKDDLLFFHRWTDENLPEECYHSWSWVPVKQADGPVVGFINSTFETTQKVLTQRRMVALRELGNNAGLARTQSEFASSILDVLQEQKMEATFAAFYFATTNDDIGSREHKPGPRTSYIRQSSEDPPITINMRLAGTVGIPQPHPSTPVEYELLLDPVTLRPSPSMRATTRDSPDGSCNWSATSSPEDIPDAATAEDSRQYSASGYESSNSDSPASVMTSAPSSTSGTTSATVMPARAAPPVWPFAEAFSRRRAVHVQNLPSYVVDGFEMRGWGEHTREAVVIPIAADDAYLPGAVLILGLNSRRPYDEEYASWIDIARVSLGALFTAVKGREADLIRAEQLAQLDDAKTSFFSNASHELRTPLTLIAGPLQDCITQVTDSHIRENLKLAARNVSRLSRLVDSLLDFSKIAANRLEGRFKPVPLGIFTADLASLFRSVMEKNDIEYNVNCDSSERKVCYIDPDFWEKIVFNLIGNAFKCCDTLSGSISVALDFDQKDAYFRVHDTGVGIPQQDLGKVFERFHRVDSTSRSYEGTGIGLSLTKELVRLHGGTLTVCSVTEAESPNEHGSCFTVTLPLGKDHLPHLHIVQSAEEIPESRRYAHGIVEEATHWSSRVPTDERTPSDSSDSGGSTDSSRMDPSTLFFVKSDVILLVDDSADMRRYMKSLFSPYCKVVEASTGKEALEILNSIKPALILSDVMMPRMDGYGLIAAVRQRPDTKLIPIILVTAKEGEEFRVQGLLSGADDYLGKPFNGRELIARVHLQMQLGKRRAELEAKFVERTREIKLLSDLSPVGIFRTDSDGRVMYVNPRWKEISGHTDDTTNDNWPEDVVPPDVPKVLQEWHTAVDLHKSASLEFRFKNGNYAKGQFEPLTTETGVLTGVIGTITDVSDQRRYEAHRLAHAQEREATARKRAEEAEERRREADERRRGQELLIDVTSHELRQPVSAILNCSSLVRSNLAALREDLWECHRKQNPFHPTDSLVQVIDDDLDALDAIYQCGLAQERIANDVLSLSRIQLQVLSIQPVEFDLKAEVERIVSIFRNEVKMKKINLDVRIGHSFDKLGVTLVCSDKSRFGQVITNLLSNGIKFTDTSVDKREIVVTTEVSRHAPAPNGPCVPPMIEDECPLDPDVATPIFVYVAVKDSGPGLNPDDLTLLFKRFQQGSNSHNVFGGSGLGLFVSRKLCDLMGGRIDVESIYGDGATFRFFVEVITTPAHAQVMDNIHRASNPWSGLTQGGQVGHSRPLHVLITEDNLINQTVLNRQLKKAGFVTVLASNGLQALEKIRAIAQSDLSKAGERRRFDAILMDCEMPVMDGLTAVREIRKLEASGELPYRNRVYALTGNARAGQVQSARDAGMDDVIIKPYKLDELLLKIQNRPNGNSHH